MSWHSTYEPALPGEFDDFDPRVDRMARHLATEAGENWEAMNNYPGYERNRWREKAETALTAFGQV
jgi:hypothetical protein